MWIPLENTTFLEAARWKRGRLARIRAAPTVAAPVENLMRPLSPAASGWRDGGPEFSPARWKGLPPGTITRQYSPSTAPPQRIID